MRFIPSAYITGPTLAHRLAGWLFDITKLASAQAVALETATVAMSG